MLEKTLESPLDCKINPDYSLEGLMLKLKLYLQLELWPPHSKSGLIGKEPDAGRD